MTITSLGRNHSTPNYRVTAAFAAVLITFSFAAACTPESQPGAQVTRPTIGSFVATSANPSSPALVTLSWKVQGVGDQGLRCRLESDAPAMQPIEIEPCRADESRNVAVTTATTATTNSYTLTVNTSFGYELTDTTAFTVLPGPTEPFDIELSGLDGLDQRIVDATHAAAARWEQVIVAGVPDTNEFPSWCQDRGEFPLPESVDDVMIHVKVDHIDGPGGTLAAAGPQCILLDGERAVTGLISIDSSDVERMIGDGILRDVLVHEMGHVLGIGTLWETSPWGSRHLLAGSGTSDPRFTGPAATAEWHKLGGEGAVPLENTGGEGTSESHWRQSIFATELMTGWIDPSPQLSAVTAASLADMGYNVDLNAVDAFALPTNGALRRFGVQGGRLIEGQRFETIPMFTP